MSLGTSSAREQNRNADALLCGIAYRVFMGFMWLIVVVPKDNVDRQVGALVLGLAFALGAALAGPMVGKELYDNSREGYRENPGGFEKRMRFWISWHQPTEDYRPITYPPNDSILGYWCSGSDAQERWTMCALVSEGSESLAKSAVEQDWPEAEDWRFCNQVDRSWRPGDRFPVAKDWERERIEGPK